MQSCKLPATLTVALASGLFNSSTTWLMSTTAEATESVAIESAGTWALATLLVKHSSLGRSVEARKNCIGKVRGGDRQCGRLC